MKCPFSTAEDKLSGDRAGIQRLQNGKRTKDRGRGQTGIRERESGKIKEHRRGLGEVTVVKELSVLLFTI